jgi:hypothetical protein
VTLVFNYSHCDRRIPVTHVLEAKILFPMPYVYVGKLFTSEKFNNILSTSFTREIKLLIYYDPFLFLYPSIKIILTGATLYWQNMTISALKGSLPVFHGQGREHNEQFL